MGKATGNNTIFKRGTQAVGEVISISALAITTDAIETTTLANDYRTFMPGLSDPGEITITGHYTGNDTGQESLYAAVDAKSTDAYSIVYPDAIDKTFNFNGFITSFSILDATNDDPVGFEVTIKLTGEPALVATP